MQRKIAGALGLVILAELAIGNPVAAQEAPAQSPSAEPLLSPGQTILGQPLAYPADAAPHVTALIVTLPPGAETGSHHHDVPLFGYILFPECARVRYSHPGRWNKRPIRPG